MRALTTKDHKLRLGCEDIRRRSTGRPACRKRCSNHLKRPQARFRGRPSGRARGQTALTAVEEARHKQQLAALVAHFASERDRFLHVVEQEVVKLALAIAARILRREAQMDPLLLTGAVRVALGQLAASRRCGCAFRRRK